jgi:cytochrome c-type biogenesis protein CcmF
MLSHFGVAMTMVGLIFSRGFEVKQTVMLHPSEAPSVFGYALTNLGQTSKFSDRNNKIEIEAAKFEADRKIDGFTAKPTLYYFMEGEEPRAMAWPSIIQRGFADYYFVIGEPQFEATDLNEFVLSADPENNPDVKAHKDVVLTYDGYEVHGSITEDGVSMLVAKMTAVTAEETFQIEPAIIVRAGEAPVGVEARIGDTYKIHLVSMDPETHAIQVWLEYIQPMYPMEVYFKPLTLFVWVGVGIMTVGGLFAAVIRRKEKKGNATETAA